MLQQRTGLVAVRRGALQLTVKKVKPFTCESPLGDFQSEYKGADISTWGRFAQTYGRFEARMAFPAATSGGIHGGFWMNPQVKTYGPWPHSGEVDVAEWWSSRHDYVHPSLHYSGQNFWADTGWWCYIGDASQFHTYAVVWEAEIMRFYYDGQLCYSRSWTPDEPLVAPQPFDHAFYLSLRRTPRRWTGPRIRAFRPRRWSTTCACGAESPRNPSRMELTEAGVAAAVAGEPAALEAVYRALAPRVQRYLWARGSDDPEGLTNEVFLTVFGRLDRLEGGHAGLVRFVFSVAHARYVDDVRRRARRPALVPYDRAEDDRLSPAAESVAIESLGTAGIYELLGRLAPDQRDVVAMRVVTGLSLEETAIAMGRSVGAVKQLQRRGLLALRELMGERGETDG